MKTTRKSSKPIFIRRMMSLCLITILMTSLVLNPISSYAQVAAPTVLNLPVPGTMVLTSEPFTPILIKGIKIFPDQPFRFDFIVDKGDSDLMDEELKIEAQKLIKYFLASLTIAEEDLWVNLSPQEPDRIVPPGFRSNRNGAGYA